MTWLNNCNPVIDWAFAFALTGFSRFLGNRLMWKYADPNFSLSFEVTIDRNPGRLNLIGGHSAARKGLYSKLTEGDCITP